MSDEIKKEYRYTKELGIVSRMWIASGKEGAVHFWVRPTEVLSHPWIGGVEQHWRSPPDYMKGRDPDHELCYILYGPCWHDGSRLYASDVLIPMFQPFDDTDRILDFMEGEYLKRFREEEEG